MIRILLTGGGSGGHVYPLLAVVEALREIVKERRLDLEMNYLGPRDTYAELLRGVDVRIRAIPAGKIRRYLSAMTLVDIPKFFVGLISALFHVFFMMPDVIFSKGGTGALPVVLAGWFYRIPIMIHESDASPGLTNLLSSYFASRIAVSFERSVKYFNSKKTAWIGTPIRQDLLIDRPPRTYEAKEALGFNPGEPLTLILGGSQGSDRINNFILSNLGSLIKETQILHQTGKANYAEVEKLSRAALIDVPLRDAKKSRYQPVPYFEDNLKTAFAAADLVIARAGSGTISEIAAFGKPAILIPLRGAANDHQRINAYEFSKTGGGIVIEEDNLLPAIFLKQVQNVLKDRNALDKMGLASSKFFKPQAAEIIAQELLRLAQRA